MKTNTTLSLRATRQYCLIFALLVQFTLMSVKAASYSGGQGTEADPYQIATVADLITLSNTSDDWEACFEQTADIAFDTNGDGDLTNEDWNGDGNIDAADTVGFSPIGNATNRFGGSYNGKLHTIKNLWINIQNHTEHDFIGFFGLIGDANLDSIALEGAEVNFSSSEIFSVGGLVGKIFDGGNINNCSADVQINIFTSGVSSCYSGGLVGYDNGYPSLISNCHATGEVKLTSFSGTGDKTYHIGIYTGGLIGYATSNMTNCYTSVDVTTASDNCSPYAGGLVGYAFSISLTDCYATGKTTINYSGDNCLYSGGLVGYGDISFSLDNCYATGDVSGTSDTPSYATDVHAYSGGLVAYIDANSYSRAILSNSFATGYVEASVTSDLCESRAYAGGLVAYSNADSITGCHASGDVYSACYATSYSRAYSGGLVAYSSGNMIADSYASGDINAYSFSSTASDDNRTYAGGLVGYNKTEISLSKCHAKGEVEASSSAIAGSRTYVGGLLGYSHEYECAIDECYATGKLTSSAFERIYSGGFAGCSYSPISNSYATGGVDASGTSSDSSHVCTGGLTGIAYRPINNSYATGEIKTSVPDAATSSIYSGGLVGYSKYSETLISNCFSTGGMKTSSSESSSVYSGGLVGSSSSAITNCYATGGVKSPSADYAGGVVGFLDATTITNCYYDSETTGMTIGVGNGDNTNANALTTVDFRDNGNFSSWTFDTTVPNEANPWVANEEGRPYLYYQQAAVSNGTIVNFSISGNITHDASSSIFAKGIRYQVTDSLEWLTQASVSGIAADSIQATLSDLQIHSDYWAQAYAIIVDAKSDTSIVYGDMAVFTAKNNGPVITITPKTAGYTGNPITADVTCTPSDPIISYRVNSTTTWSTTAPTNIGDYDVRVLSASTEDYIEADSICLNALIIVKGDQPITSFVDITDKVYGDDIFTLSASAQGEISYSVPDNSDVVTISNNSVTITNAGTVKIIATVAGNSNYEENRDTITLSVSKAELTATADKISRSYGEASTSLTISYSGFVYNDDYTALTTAPIASCNADASSSIGDSLITLSGGVSNNYNFTYQDNILSITPATLTVSADKISIVYSEAIPALTFSYSGFVNGENSTVLTTEPSISCSADANSSVSNSLITLEGGSADNYSFDYINDTLHIMPAELTVTADKKTKAYGETPPALTFSYSGFVNGEDIAALTTEPNANCNVDVSSSVGDSLIILSGGEADNYSFTYVSDTLHITPATLTVIADKKSKIYGEANPSFSFSYSGFVNNDDYTTLTTEPIGVCNADASSFVGDSLITPSGAVAVNYSFTYVSNTLSITPAPLTVSACDTTKAWGTELQNQSECSLFTCSALCNDDKIDFVTLLYKDGAATDAAMGIYTDQVMVSDARGSQFEAINYNITYIAGDIEVINPIDTDNDGTPDHLDDDDDGDGIPDTEEDSSLDTDNDGVPNNLDSDDDGDGLSTADEDLDGDGDPTNDYILGSDKPAYLTSVAVVVKYNETMLVCNNVQEIFESYQWYQNGILVGTNQSLHAPEGLSGSYYLAVTTVTGEVIRSTDFDFAQAKSVTVYPNPSTSISKFTVEIKGIDTKVDECSIRIYDLLGKCIFIENNAQATTSIVNSDFRAGSYIITISNEDNILSSEKLIITE